MILITKTPEPQELTDAKRRGLKDYIALENEPKSEDLLIRLLEKSFPPHKSLIFHNSYRFSKHKSQQSRILLRFAL